MENVFNFDEFKKSVEAVDLKKDVAAILNDEIKHRGVDWHKFYDGDANQLGNAEKAFGKYKIPIPARAVQGGASLMSSDDIEDTAIWAITNEPGSEIITYVQSLEGDDLKKYVVRIIQTLKLAEMQTTPGALAMQVYSGGVAAIGATWAGATAAAYVYGATGLQAIIAGLKIATVATAISAIAVILMLVFIPFIIFMEKKAEISGIVLNRTKHKMNVSKLYFNHGHMLAKSNVEDIFDLPKRIFCPAGKSFDMEEDGKLFHYELCCAGIFYASKLDYALYGVEGAFRVDFLSGSQFPNGVNIGFSVPLAVGSNKCGISWDNYSGPEEYFEKNYDKFTTAVQQSDASREIQAHINSTSGGEVYMIAVVRDKKF